jgi:hypothetical protein
VLYTGISAHLIQQPRFGKSSVTPNGTRRKPEHISHLLFAEADEITQLDNLRDSRKKFFQSVQISDRLIPSSGVLVFYTL